MIEIETSNATGTPSLGKTMKRSASFSSPSKSSEEIPCGGLSPTKQSSFSAIVKVSKMQANFAERTAAEMEEILSWYQKYEGVDRLKKENQQIQSMPHNAMIVVDDDIGDDNDNTGDESEKEIAHKNDNVDDKEEGKPQKIHVDEEEFVTVKDFHTPTHHSRVTKPLSSQKKTTSLLLSAVRSISKARKKKYPPPPLAIKLSSEDEDDAAISPVSSKRRAGASTKGIHPPSTVTVVGDSIQENANQEETLDYRDQEKEVLAMLSPRTDLKAHTLISNTDDYVDQEEEVLELLLSPSSCSSKSMLSLSGRRSPVGTSNESLSGLSTGEEAQNQIEAADEVIRNTQNMADIIQQLQQSSLLCSSSEDSNDNDDGFANFGNDKGISDDSSSPASSSSLTSARGEFDIVTTTGIRNRFQSRKRDGSRRFNPPLTKIQKDNFSGFLGRQVDRLMVTILLSLAIGFFLKNITA